MRKYIITNNIVEPINIQEDFLKDSFPAAIYAIKSNLSGFYLELIQQKFDVPDKVYGSTKKRSKKILSAFERRPGTTGVMLTGPKGTGKSLLAKVAANKAIEKGYPVIRIQDALHGEKFNSFIQELGPCVLLFDEFAKIYDDREHEVNLQNELLSLFDGVASSKKLILLTENRYVDIDDLYKNRPSRVFYSWQYANVEESIIKGYCKDNLKHKQIIPKIIELSEKTSEFSFDVLQAVVDECNHRLGDDDFDELIQDLNLDINEMVEYFEIISFNVSPTQKYISTPTDEVDSERPTPQKNRRSKRGNSSNDHPTNFKPTDQIVRMRYAGEFHMTAVDSETGERRNYYFNLNNPVSYKKGIYTLKGDQGTIITGRKILAPKTIWNSNAF